MESLADRRSLTKKSGAHPGASIRTCRSSASILPRLPKLPVGPKQHCHSHTVGDIRTDRESRIKAGFGNP